MLDQPDILKPAYRLLKWYDTLKFFFQIAISNSRPVVLSGAFKKCIMEEVKGDIHISYSIECPHCTEYLTDRYDKQWFYNTVGDDFPIDNGYEGEFPATCPKCKQDFLIKGFVY